MDRKPSEHETARPTDDDLRRPIAADRQARLLLVNAGVEKRFSYARGGLPS